MFTLGVWAFGRDSSAGVVGVQLAAFPGWPALSALQEAHPQSLGMDALATGDFFIVK